MIKSIPTKHKLLCISENKDNLFIGDAGGNIIEFSLDCNIPRIYLAYESPISCIFFSDHNLYFGAWDSCLSNGKKKVKLGNNMIKCGIVFKERIFVSVDMKLIILDLDLNIISSIESKFKILSMGIYQQKLHFGHSSGFISTFEEDEIKISKSIHETSVIVLKNGLSGSQDCSIAKDNKLIYSGNGWTRAIVDENLFSCGKDVIKNGSILYSHTDEVTGLVKIENSIVSIGLDRCIKVYNECYSMSKNEEDEMMKLLLS